METSGQMTGTDPTLSLFISKKLPQLIKIKKKNLYLMLCFHQFHPTPWFYRILTKARYKKHSHKKDTEKPVPAEIWSPKYKKKLVTIKKL